MATALLDAGATVAITGRDAARAETAARELGRGCLAVGMDVRDEDDVARGVDRVWDALGGLDVLVNNAGIGMRTVNPRFLTDPQPFWAVSPDGFRDVVATNLTGYFLVARTVVPRLLSAGGGRVVNVSMNHSTMNRKGLTPYGPARAGAEAQARIMAADLSGSGVTANILLPGGATATGMIPDDFPPEQRAQLLDPAVMGPPIRWLCSPQAAGCTTSGSWPPSSTPGSPPAGPDSALRDIDGLTPRPGPLLARRRSLRCSRGCRQAISMA